MAQHGKDVHLLVLCILLCIICSFGHLHSRSEEIPKDFTGYKVYSLLPSDEHELNFLKELKHSKKAYFWNAPIDVNNKVNVHVCPKLSKQLENKWRSEGIDFYLISDNLQRWIDEEREANTCHHEVTGRCAEEFKLDQYHTFESISAYLDTTAVLYAKIASIQTIGTTFEGCPIKGLKIGGPGVNKPVIWIDAGIHAREWVAPATALYIISHLVKGYDTDPEIKDLVDSFDWHIFPVINPDGYKYTWTNNRLWRKNRKPDPNSKCLGVDPNRNFDIDFGGEATSGNPCSEIYKGKSAFSEKESSAIRDGLKALGKRVKVYFTLHSFFQLWMSPYGYTYACPPDYDKQMIALELAHDAIKNTHGISYEYGTIADVIFPVGGSSVDWVYKDAKVTYSFAIELRDDGREGFMLNNTQIIPCAEENFAGIKAVAKMIKTET